MNHFLSYFDKYFVAETKISNLGFNGILTVIHSIISMSAFGLDGLLKSKVFCQKIPD